MGGIHPLSLGVMNLDQSENEHEVIYRQMPETGLQQTRYKERAVQ